MGKNKKKSNKPKQQVNTETVNDILLEDKNNISDAATNAMKNVDSVAYADNLVESSSSSKSIRNLDIKEKEKEKENVNVNLKDDGDTEKIVSIDDTVTSLSKEITNNSVSTEKNLKDVTNSSSSTKKDLKKITNSSTSKEKSLIEANDKEYKVVDQKKSYKTAIILSIAFVIIVVLFLLFSTIFALLNSTKTTIISGISIKDIDISGLTKEQASEKISSEFSKKTSQAITLKHNDFEQTILPEQFEVSFSLNDAVNIAYNKGRSRKCFSK